MGEKAFAKVEAEDDAQRNKEEQQLLLQSDATEGNNAQPENPYKGIGNIEGESHGNVLVRFNDTVAIVDLGFELVFSGRVQVCVFVEEGMAAVNDEDDTADDAGDESHRVVFHDVG